MNDILGIFLFVIILAFGIGFLVPGKGKWYHQFGESKKESLPSPEKEEALLPPHSFADHVEFNFIEQDVRDAYRNLMIAIANAITRVRAAGLTDENVKKLETKIETSIGILNGFAQDFNNTNTENEFGQLWVKSEDDWDDFLRSKV